RRCRRGQGVGQLVIRDAQSGSAVRLDVARYHVHVVLAPPVALVQIDQSFYNPYSAQEEGTFVFNLPRGASVSRFAMYVTPDQLIEGELVDRSRARTIYESIVRRRRDPAILEQIGDNLFRMRVFPIAPKSTKRILLDYTIPIRSRGGRYRFRLPLFSDLEPIWDFRISGVVCGAVDAESLASPSHPAVTFEARRDGSFHFRFSRHDYRPQRDFVLRFRRPSHSEVMLRSYVAQPLPVSRPDTRVDWVDPWWSRAATYFMVSIPPQPREGCPARAPADVLILADTSSSMMECGELNSAVATVVNNLMPGDRFRLMALDVAARPLHDGWAGAGTRRADEVLLDFEEQFCLGGTGLVAGLSEALKSFPRADGDSGRRRLVIYVGDGEETMIDRADDRLDTQLAQQLEEAEAAFVALVARSSANGESLLYRTARATGGLVFALAGDPNGYADLLEWLLSGMPVPERVTRVEVDWAADEDVIWPTAWLPGEPLEIYGRVPKTNRIRLTVVTRRAGRQERREWELDTGDQQDDVFVGRLWAQKRMEALRRREWWGASRPQLREQIVRLSQEWSLLCPYTAFLVLESEADYQRWNVVRRLRRRYWKPPEAVAREPLPAGWLERITQRHRQRQREAEAKRVAEAVRNARQELAAGDFQAAFARLRAVRRLEAARGSEEFEQVYQQALEAVRRETVVEGLGPHQALFDARLRGKWLRLQPSLAPLLLHTAGLSEQFLRINPHGIQLLRPVEVRRYGGGRGRLTLEGFADLLAELTD
ncbi:MAG TPA: hypothetical protein EYP56_15410, partial [Planctomycetaceae bacterium]|nr:hypothetical protein [Planctomycetaceae bacterium]